MFSRDGFVLEFLLYLVLVESNFWEVGFWYKWKNVFERLVFRIFENLYFWYLEF